MSDIPPPPPQSSIQRFGTSIVGKSFEWEHVLDDGTTRVITARAAATLSFEDVLRYTTGRHSQLIQVAKAGQAMKTALDQTKSTDEDYVAKFNQIVEERLAHEHASWEAAIDILLILVAEPYRAELRQPLIDGDPKTVNELRSWLEREVLGGAEVDAAVAANVDPTSRQPPQPSVSDPGSGDESGSAESASTD